MLSGQWAKMYARRDHRVSHAPRVSAVSSEVSRTRVTRAHFRGGSPSVDGCNGSPYPVGELVFLTGGFDEMVGGVLVGGVFVAGVSVAGVFVGGQWAVALGVLSLVLFVVGLLAAPVIVARLPRDYFCDARVSRPAPARGAVLLLFVRVAKNVLGLCLLLAGIAMLVLPGQGLLTILAALLILDFPGKRALLQRLYRVPRVERALNWMRKKMKKEPFETPGDQSARW